MAGAADQSTGDHWADTVDIGEPTAGLGDHLTDLHGQRLQALVSVADLGDEVAAELLAGSLDRPGGPHAGQQA